VRQLYFRKPPQEFCLFFLARCFLCVQVALVFLYFCVLKNLVRALVEFEDISGWLLNGIDRKERVVKMERVAIAKF
jgi:hypothetical protein